MNKRSIISLMALLFLVVSAKAQQLATWPLSTKNATPTPVAANVVAGNMIFGTPATFTSGGFKTGYLQLKQSSLWPNSAPNAATQGFYVDFPISPAANYDLLLTGCSFQISYVNNVGNADFPTAHINFSLAYQIDGAGVWIPFATQQGVVLNNTNATIATPYTVNFGAINTPFYGQNTTGPTHTFAVRMYMYSVDGANKAHYFGINNFIVNGNAITPQAINPTVQTTSAATFGFYDISADGTYDIGATYRSVKKAGFLTSTNPIPTFAIAKIDTVTTLGSPINVAVGNLTPATQYSVCAFAITKGNDTVLGNILSRTTTSSQKPILFTSAPTNYLSNKATTGGYNLDSTGVPISKKGILYSSVTNVLDYNILSIPRTNDGAGSTNFVTTLTGLTPSTKYYVMAYAINALGIGYGNLESFTTLAPVPVISATPNTLDFGDVTYNATQPILSYKLNANYLNSTTGGSINLSVNNSNYTISSTINGTYSSTITLPYTASTIANKIIYVKSSTNTYGNISAMILHTGGGTIAPNADTVFLKTNVVQNADTLSNAGSDFWCGFGYQEKMKSNTTQFDTTLSGGGAHLSIFIAAGNAGDSVIVELPGIINAPTFPRKVFVPANGFVEVGGFPVGDGSANNPTNGPDTRLYYTGVSQRGIHIYSKSGVPVSAWLYDWNVGDAAAGAMLFPTNTWNSSYVVQAVGGKANNSGYNNNSFFFVIAKDDNTVIKFKPTNNILDSNSATLFKNGAASNIIRYKKDSTYSITLNRGEIFNAMGYVGNPDPSSSDPGALDLSGTTISTSCDKKIAVFGGNGRCVLGTTGSNPTSGINCTSPTSGSDNLIQQMFPKVAWGTVYLTVPTKNMANNLFRVYVQDVTTDVKLNNVLLPKVNLINGLYYQFDINKPSKIESNIPISVTQFIVSGYCSAGTSAAYSAYGNIGDGDPEMITLSPVQQSIKSTTFYSAIFKNGNSVPSEGASYVNVVVKGINGVNSFLLDGLSNNADTGTNTFTGSKYAHATGITSMANAFKKHPQDSNYYYATFWVNSRAKHTLASDGGFNAIAYGVSKGESYGYNAGTTINNLSAVNISINPNGTDTSTGSVKAVKNNLLYLQIAVPYDTTTITSIIWDANGNPNVTPIGPDTGIINPTTNKPVCLGTIVKDGRTFYIYQSPQKYTFKEDGAYKIKVTLSGTFVSDCGGTDVKNINVLVGHDDISFTTQRVPIGDCKSKQVFITDNSTGFYGTAIEKWIWDFGDNSKKDTVLKGSTNNPTINPHTYPNNAAYTIILTTINSIGGVSIDSMVVDLSFILNSTFTKSQDTLCPNAPLILTPTSSAGATKWYWNYGDGSPLDSTTTSNPVSHSYTIEGNHLIQHWVANSAGCISTKIDSNFVHVAHKPIANFILPSGVCLPGNTLFTNTSDTAFVPTVGMPYTYHWDFGVASLTTDTSNIKNPLYAYPNVAPPTGGYPVTLTATSKLGCISTPVVKSLNNIYDKPVAIIGINSDKKVCEGSDAHFYDASTATNQTITAWSWSIDGTGTAASKNLIYKYLSNKLDTVKLVITTDKGCVSDTSAIWTIKVNPKPVVNTILPSSCITSGSLLFKDNSTAVDDSIQTPFTYTWTFGDTPPTVFTNKDETHTYSGIGTYIINHSVTTLNGCTNTKVDTFTISGSKPISKYNVPFQGGLGLHQYCTRETISLIDSSTIAIGTIKKVVIYWDTSATRFPGANLSTTPTIDINPQNGVAPIAPKTYTFKYPYSLLSKSPIIRVLTYNSDSCYSETFLSLTIFGQPTLKFDTLRSICLDGTPKKINFAYDSTGFFDAFNYVRLFKKPTYSGNGVYNDSMFNPTTAGAGTHLIQVIYETRQPANHHCFDTGYAPITVWALPTVKFDTAIIKCQKDSVQFFDASVAYTGSGNISSPNLLWHFGEPSSGAADSSNLKNPKHLYSNFGSYTISLKVTTDSGCSNTLSPTKTITINPKPVVGFISPKGVCKDQPSIFTDTSKIAYGTFTHSWNFGDPTSATNTVSGTYNPTPSHLYSGGVTDTIRLIVTSNFGCIDSAKLKVTNSIIPFPVTTPSYKINGVLWDTLQTKTICLGTPLTFTSGFKANDYTWNFGDSAATVNKGAIVNHTYPTANTFTGSFSIVDTNGCPSKSIPIKVQTFALPIVDFDTALIKCERDSILFIDKSTTANGTINSWLWHFGEPSSLQNDSSKIPTPKHLYSSYGTYTINLKVTTDNGCVGVLNPAKTIIVNPKPQVNFTMPDTVCLPTAVQFVDATTIAYANNQTPFTFDWTFGDVINNTATGTPALHTYSSSNNYTITLKVTTKNSCIESLPKVLKATNIHNQPIAAYTVNTPNHDTPSVCIGKTIIFKDASINVYKSFWVWKDGLSDDEGLIVSHFNNTPANSSGYNGYHYIIDNFKCQSNLTPFVTIINAKPTINVGNPVFVLPNNSSILTPTYTNATSFLWTITNPTGLVKDYLDNDSIDNPICTPLTDATYLIQAWSGDKNNDCWDTASYTVKLLKMPKIPTAFSPNGDGINDKWEIGGLDEYIGSTVQVFNRAGQLVLNKFGYSNPWNGTYLGTGANLPIGVYYYIIKPGQGMPLMTGYVTILR